MVLFWGGLLAVAVYLIRRRPAAATSGAGTSPAEMTLAERYARGEIDAEEYRRRQAVLRERRDEGPGY
jgi:putative membrane protein